MDASWVIGEHGEQHELFKSSTWIVTGSDQWVNPNISNLKVGKITHLLAIYPKFLGHPSGISFLYLPRAWKGYPKQQPP